MILSIPWLILAIILYNMIAFTSSWPAPGTPGTTNVFNEPLVSFDLISGANWALTVGDLVTIITLVLLFVELIKATRTGGSSIVDHAFSMVLFMICGVEFLTVRQAATSEFFFILVVTLIDVVAGFSITIRGARRDFGMGGVHD
ncbi:MAG: hypothetical protein M3N35_00240 [Candidatus Binatota bacterium]|nr:hypothetical protein [Candidatus Binatota bacterium]